ncbi:MAG: hypothetical protein ACRCSK_04875, partial [Fusobacteriaceae bacterium]
MKKIIGGLVLFAVLFFVACTKNKDSLGAEIFLNPKIIIEDKLVESGIGFQVPKEKILRNYASITNKVGTTTTIGILVYVGGTAINYSIINANDGIGIDLMGGTTTSINLSPTNALGYNMGNGLITVENGIGVRGGEDSSFYNKGKIKVNNIGGTGILSQNSFVENTGEIYVYDGTGIKAIGNKSNVINYGKIDVTNSGVGVYISEGALFKNYGAINILGGIGVKVSETENTFYNNNLISVQKGCGIDADSGAKISNENDGLINVGSNNGIGMCVTGKDSLAINFGKVEIISGTGIHVSGGAQAKNYGNIYVETGKGVSVENSSGLFVNESTGIINIDLLGTGINVKEGTAKNYGTINSGAGYGSYISSTGKFYNYGDIYVDSGYGIYGIDKSEIENHGQIKIKLASGTGIYVSGESQAKN